MAFIVEQAGGSATIAPFDLTDSDAIDRLGSAIGARWGRLDALILNAAQLGTLAPVPHLDLKEWDKLIALNLTANMRLIRALDPWLRQSAAGHVVAVTSSVTRIFRSPRPHAASAEELARHAEFMAGFSEPIWSR